MDGVAASNYVDLLGTEAKMHRTIATCRLLARFAPRFIHWLHARDLNMPAVLYMGRVLPEVRLRYRRLCARLTLTTTDHVVTTAAAGGGGSGAELRPWSGHEMQSPACSDKTSLHRCRWPRERRPGRG